MSSTSVVVCTGKSSKKFINNSEDQVDVTPFIGQDHMGQFGVGFKLLHNNGCQEGRLWGLMMPQHLIQSWRAMKMIEELPRIELCGTLTGSWYMARENLGYDSRYLDKEGHVFGDYEKFRELRARVLAMFPNNDELIAMLALAEENSIKLDTYEIEEERNKLSSADEILKRLRIADDARCERNRLEAEVSANREAERAKIPIAAILPKRQGFFSWLFS
jgi:hypothetical protein